jgi:hypothetical protein
MPATTFPEYARRLADALDTVVATGEAVLVTLQVDQRSAVRGCIAGSVQFEPGSELHFCEFVDVTQAEPRIMYAYHYQDADNTLICRYDNAAHRPAPPQPEHKHTRAGIEAAPAPTLAEVLDQILQQMH